MHTLDADELKNLNLVAKKVKDDRESELVAQLQEFLNTVALEVMTSSGIKYEMDLSLGVDRKKVLITALRNTANELEKT